MSATDPPHPPNSRAASTCPLRIDELVAFFTSSVGEEKAREAVGAVLSRMHLAHKNELNRAEALSVLDEIATTPGIVGVAARFAKARILLRKF
jgi:hypothetical protein